MTRHVMTQPVVTQTRVSAVRRMSPTLRSRMLGLSLIELMIAIVLGLLVVAAAGSIFVANRRTYRATESLSRIQENSRLAFELMAKDIREASGSACNSMMVPANMLNPAGGPWPWWSDLPNGLIGYDNGALTGSLAGTDAIQLVSATAGSYPVQQMATTNAVINLTTTSHDLVIGDVLLICDVKCATTFQTTNAATGSSAISHVAGTPVLPGNSAATLICNADPFGVADSDPTAHKYDIDAVIGRVSASQWYVATTPAGGQSLFRKRVLQGVVPGTGQEIVEGVTDMQLTYLVAGDTAYKFPTVLAPIIWKNVVAVRIILTLQGSDNIGTNGAALSRTVSHVVYIRNPTQ